MNNEFWQSTESRVLLNPRLPDSTQDFLRTAIEQNPRANTVWLKSSGTESSQQGHKLVALSRAAILGAAQGVNEFLKVTDQDRWMNPLPLFHIGGLAISARCFLAGARQSIFSSWDPVEFERALIREKSTITSLVPTQVYDLVQAGLTAPRSLRIVLVGGGALSQELYLQARDLGWPLLPSYGMTETSAVMAAASRSSLQTVEFPKAEILPHVFFKPMLDGRYRVESVALYSGFLWVQQGGLAVWEPRPDPFVLDDRIEITGSHLTVLGRSHELVKVLGETVNLHTLTQTLQIKIPKNLIVLARPHERKGFELHLVVESEPFALPLEDINQGLLPFEKISQIHFLNPFPRTELGKVHLAQIKNQIWG